MLSAAVTITIMGEEKERRDQLDNNAGGSRPHNNNHYNSIGIVQMQYGGTFHLLALYMINFCWLSVSKHGING